MQDGNTYIMFSYSDNIVLGNTSSADTFDVRDRYIAHNFSSSIANRAVLLDQHAISEHSTAGAG